MTVTVLGEPPPPIWSQWWFWTIIVLASVAAVPLLLSIRYYRNSKKQRKLLLAYESELEKLPISDLDRARAQFIKHAIESQEKIKRFNEIYDTTIRPSKTLDEAAKKHGIDIGH